MKRKIKNYYFDVEYDWYCMKVLYRNGYGALKLCSFECYTFYNKQYEKNDKRLKVALEDLDFVDFGCEEVPYWVFEYEVNKHGKVYCVNNEVAYFFLDLYQEFGSGLDNNDFVLNVLAVDKKDIDEVDTEVLTKYMEEIK